MKRKSLFVLFIILITVFFSNFIFFKKESYAASPSFESVKLIKEDKSSHDKWNWEFEVKTKNVAGVKILINIYKGSSKISSNKYSINDNYLDYSTNYVLDDKTTYSIIFTIDNINRITFNLQYLLGDGML